ncbi:hypothetical protein K493DRAFT_321310 [Basidiobolus meristosporus CBS 931.73]|uniref:Pacifastin domain-containing protein n=1 Tax=Basidiobolus meristosporus CBS 931.73 TaxID=1314790 RepID=A0A1Y1WXD5_9FUNG|nr:hypothetical protein K493DRAFT_321310 [Basidiobolus meristosporus CBS 931.73]|eukprot:ORX77866.1 hypothetical protein K493DRAFT_321310 [Basidiobolus meristosporus CBS 931.73]
MNPIFYFAFLFALFFAQTQSLPTPDEVQVVKRAELTYQDCVERYGEGSFRYGCNVCTCLPAGGYKCTRVGCGY